MATLRLFATLSALLASVSAQTPDTTVTKVWAAVAFINHGERTPDFGGLHTALTPEGAQQMWRQGSAFRSRYLSGDIGSNRSEHGITGAAPIEDIETTALDNAEVTIFSQTDEWVVGGAMAFLQGLYPPATQAYNTLAGGLDMAHNYADDKNVTDYPLNGYQYPKIQTLSATDSSSPYIQGTIGCTAWQSEMQTNLTTREDIAGLYNATYFFYQKLFTDAPLKGTISLDDANFWNALEIYDFVTYMYKHNETVFDGLDDAETTLLNLKRYATDLERAKNSQVTTDEDDKINTLYTIAGSTLAKKIAQQLLSNISWNAAHDKMTLLFGSFEPFLAFLSISGILTANDLSSGPFEFLPEPGAMMVFELIGNNLDHPDVQPAPEDLSVRFGYRASADEDEPFQNRPLFDSGFDGNTIPYNAFMRKMLDLGTSADAWCDVCGPTTATWCISTDFTGGEGGGDGSTSGGKSSLSPAIGGVIGAVIMGAVVGLIGLALFFIGGFRLACKDAKERNSSLGGFKGAEKMQSDTDLAVGKAGARHERIGSWELQGENNTPAPTGGAGIVTADFNRARVDDDGVSVMGATPVSARESV